MHKIVLATNNQGKTKEIAQILQPLNIEIISQSEFHLESVAETGLSFVENAIIKARYASEKTGLPALADDSGLQVFALNDAPGIYSSRYAGENASDEDNVNKLLQDLTNEKNRTARFCCIMVYLTHPNDPTPIISEGYWQGSILNEPQGNNGFGYDPIFYVPEHDCSAAQLTSDIKNQISHRAQALHNIPLPF